MTNHSLADLAEIFDCEHKTAPTTVDSDFYSIRTADISNGRILYQNANRVSEGTYVEWTKRAIPQTGDIILAREAPVGEVGWIHGKRRICLGQRTVLIKPTAENLDNKFLLYYLTNPLTKYELQVRSGGSVVAHLNVKDIRNFKISLPKLAEQKTIASILSGLDDKIDLLQRQNQTLEAMAETLFRQRFIEEAQEDWERGTLGELTNIDTGFAFKSKYYQEVGELRVVRGKNVTIGNLRWGTDAKFWSESVENLEKYYLQRWDIVIGMDGSRIGQNRALVLESDLPAILAQRVARVRAKRINQQPFVWRHIFSDNFQEYIKAIHTGTSIPHISQSQIAEYEILIPPKKIIEEYSIIVQSFWDKYEINAIEISTLKNLRDTLLPKLMNGEVRVQIDD